MKNFGLITIENQLPRKNDKIPQNDDDLFSQICNLGFSPITYDSALDKSLEISYTRLNFVQYTFTQYYFLPFVQNWFSIFIPDCLNCPLN